MGPVARKRTVRTVVLIAGLLSALAALGFWAGKRYGLGEAVAEKAQAVMDSVSLPPKP